VTIGDSPFSIRFRGLGIGNFTKIQNLEDKLAKIGTIHLTFKLETKNILI